MCQRDVCVELAFAARPSRDVMGSILRICVAFRTCDFGAVVACRVVLVVEIGLLSMRVTRKSISVIISLFSLVLGA